MESYGGREGEREREKERKRNRKKERERDRQTETEGGRGERETETDRDRQGQTVRRREREREGGGERPSSLPASPLHRTSGNTAAAAYKTAPTPASKQWGISEADPAKHNTHTHT